MKASGYDAIIVGAGLMGASAAAALAKAGKSVLVLDSHEKFHALGSSHGHARIIRSLASEAKVFPGTANASWQAIRAMEKSSGSILREMPAVFIVEASSQAHQDLLKEVTEREGEEKRPALDIRTAGQINREYGFRMDANEVAFIDKKAGIFDPAAVLAHLYDAIESHGGVISFETEVVNWTDETDGVTVTIRGDHPVLRASQLVLATGAWTAQIAGLGNLDRELAQALAGAMILQRIPVYYFEYPADMKEVIPITFTKEGRVEMYAMPERHPGRGTLLKAGFHYGDAFPNPDSVPRIVEESEKKEARIFMEDRLARNLTLLSAEVCLYAMTEKDIPLVGPMPGTRNTFVSTYAGGNCAKHAVALGDALSHLMQSPHDLREFSPLRL